MLDLYCSECVFLNLTEEEQQMPKNLKFNRNHYCILFNKNLIHESGSKNILRLECCFEPSELKCV